MPTALAQGEKPVPFRVAEGYGQLALGNVGLALESFRKATREDPSSTAALLGIAMSYDKMGRFDLSRRHYEAALAIAPGDTRLLGALASSLELQGLGVEAASVRNEIAVRLAAKDVAPAVEPHVANVTPIAPVEQAEAAATAQRIEQAAVAPARAQIGFVPEPTMQAEVAPLDRARFAPSRVAAATEAVAVQRARAEVAAVAEPDLAIASPVDALPAQPARSVTVKLPPPRPATAVFAEATADEPAPGSAPGAVLAQAPVARTKVAEADGPRLVRLSKGVIALVTADAPIWRSEPVSRTASSTTVRFVPIRSESRTAEIRLLNAARVHRLAARTRAYLSGHGWRGISIGDAESTRARSLILYPEGQRLVARRLSKQFGFAIARTAKVEQVTVLLGRDSVRVAGARAGA